MPDQDDILQLSLPAHPSSPMHARALVEQLHTTLDEDTLADVQVIASELVTNAIRYGQPTIVLRLRRSAVAIDVSVLDHGEGRPEMQPLTATKGSGRGLAIIEGLASGWGCQTLTGETGKIVWATVTTPQPGPGS